MLSTKNNFKTISGWKKVNDGMQLTFNKLSKMHTLPPTMDEMNEESAKGPIWICGKCSLYFTSLFTFSKMAHFVIFKYFFNKPGILPL